MFRLVRLRAPLGSRSLTSSSFTPPAFVGRKPPHLLTLADLSQPQIQELVSSAIAFKTHYKADQPPALTALGEIGHQSLAQKTVALMFNKRSTRTRVASETATQLLGSSAGDDGRY